LALAVALALTVPRLGAALRAGDAGAGETEDAAAGAADADAGEAGSHVGLTAASVTA
jgi:hypothetical protein